MVSIQYTWNKEGNNVKNICQKESSLRANEAFVVDRPCLTLFILTYICQIRFLPEFNKNISKDI